VGAARHDLQLHCSRNGETEPGIDALDTEHANAQCGITADVNITVPCKAMRLNKKIHVSSVVLTAASTAVPYLKANVLLSTLLKV
jgi:hypothetical protein